MQDIHQDAAPQTNPEASATVVAPTSLFEVAWEVCNQVGGIYTVIRSKIPAAVKSWGREHYCLLGPYIHKQVAAVFEPIVDQADPIYQAVQVMRESGYDVHYGNWLVSGSPRTVLFNPYSIYHRLGDIKYDLWENHHIATPGNDDLLNQVLTFGHQVKVFFRIFTGSSIFNESIIVHFHEWMAGTSIPDLRRDKLPLKIIFTTHATLLGRYLAMNDSGFYDHLYYYDWAKESQHFNVEPAVNIERAAAHGAHIFSTVSEVTAMECRQLLGRNPDVLLPNGLNIERFEVLHEFQNLHKTYKDKIHEFVMAHFFPSYSFDLEKTLYFFTSGRFEYNNKGFDLTLEALARLNWRLKQAGSDMTVITFFISRQPTHSIKPEVMNSRVMLDEVHKICEDIHKQVGERLFHSITSTYKMPDLNDLVSENLKLALRRTVQANKSEGLPPTVTHNLVEEWKDPIVNFLNTANLHNHKEDKVKIVYHPDFIGFSNPLFRIDYPLFVRGCHLGIFPSYYEPWGYTPLECLASGLPSITSDLSGFGDFVLSSIPNHEEMGMKVIRRKNKSFDEAANELTDELFKFVMMNRRERVALRNRSENASVFFDWKELYRYYETAYNMAKND